ncbi:MAG TPA: hypothetical protein PLG90_05405 [Ignavibacteria bacterium]|nr:hypothetical protein [Ignavibacteria bacterium]
MFKILFVILLIVLIFALLMSGIIIRVYRMFKPKTGNYQNTPPKTQIKKEIKNDDSRVIDVDYEEIK